MITDSSPVAYDQRPIFEPASRHTSLRIKQGVRRAWDG